MKSKAKKYSNTSQWHTHISAIYRYFFFFIFFVIFFLFRFAHLKLLCIWQNEKRKHKTFTTAGFFPAQSQLNYIFSQKRKQIILHFKRHARNNQSFREKQNLVHGVVGGVLLCIEFVNRSFFCFFKTNFWWIFSSFYPNILCILKIFLIPEIFCLIFLLYPEILIRELLVNPKWNSPYASTADDFCALTNCFNLHPNLT